MGSGIVVFGTHIGSRMVLDEEGCRGMQGMDFVTSEFVAATLAAGFWAASRKANGSFCAAVRVSIEEDTQCERPDQRKHTKTIKFG